MCVCPHIQPAGTVAAPSHSYHQTRRWLHDWPGVAAATELAVTVNHRLIRHIRHIPGMPRRCVHRRRAGPPARKAGTGVKQETLRGVRRPHTLAWTQTWPKLRADGAARPAASRAASREQMRFGWEAHRAARRYVYEGVVRVRVDGVDGDEARREPEDAASGNAVVSRSDNEDCIGKYGKVGGKFPKRSGKGVMRKFAKAFTRPLHDRFARLRPSSSLAAHATGTTIARYRQAPPDA
jgi:hypothetical protein